MGTAMKKNILLALTTLLSVNTFAINKVIYGKDNRVESRLHPNKNLRILAKSVAARVSQYDIYKDGDQYSFPTRSLSYKMNVCESERFKDQVSLSDCTGFLVGKDILVTAGHCMETKSDCKRNQWVFGFDDTSKRFSQDQVYSCAEVIEQEAKYNLLGYAKDFAVIRLDREVVGRAPLKFRSKGKLSKGSRLAVIGHPVGLPMKTADDGRVKNTYGLTFKANLDTYGGNSGSPVFNLKTLEVEGILVQGKNDFESKEDEICYVSSYAKGKGEKVYKINKIKSLKKLKKAGKL